MMLKTAIASILLGCLLTCGMVAGENAPIVSEEAKELAIISIEGYSQVQDERLSRMIILFLSLLSLVSLLRRNTEEN